MFWFVDHESWTTFAWNPFSIPGINTPRKFRIALRYLRRMLPHFSWGGDQALESADERDSGIRTGSEPTSPLASEGENDHVHFNATNLISQYPLPGSTLAEAGSEHRFVFSQDLQVVASVLTKWWNSLKFRPPAKRKYGSTVSARNTKWMLVELAAFFQLFGQKSIHARFPGNQVQLTSLFSVVTKDFEKYIRLAYVGGGY